MHGMVTCLCCPVYIYATLKKNQRAASMLKWKFILKVNSDCTCDPGTRVPVRELHTRPGYINTRILPGLLVVHFFLHEVSVLLSCRGLCLVALQLIYVLFFFFLMASIIVLVFSVPHVKLVYLILSRCVVSELNMISASIWKNKGHTCIFSMYIVK